LLGVTYDSWTVNVLTLSHKHEYAVTIGAFYLVTQIDTNIVLSFLAFNK